MKQVILNSTSSSSSIVERSRDQVEAGLLEMDQMYGASFTAWLRNEENVSVAATYLQPIVSDYNFLQISSAIRWLECGWKSESTAWLIHELFQTWKCQSDSNSHGDNTNDLDYMRAKLIRFLMNTWSVKKQAQFITHYFEVDVLYSHPSPSRFQFLKFIFQSISFPDLSQLFSLVGTSLDYASKVSLLQNAARPNMTQRNTIKRSSDPHPNPMSMKRAKSNSPPPPPTTGLGLISLSDHHQPSSLDNNTTSFTQQLHTMLDYPPSPRPTTNQLPPRITRTYSTTSPPHSPHPLTTPANLHHLHPHHFRLDSPSSSSSSTSLTISPSPASPTTAAPFLSPTDITQKFSNFV